MTRTYDWLNDPQRNSKINGSRLNDELDRIVALPDSPTWTGNHTFTPTSGDGPVITMDGTAVHGLTINQSPSFSGSSTFILNHITITDTAHQSDDAHPINGLTVDINTGAFGGARQAITGNVTTGGALDVGTKDAFLVGGAFGAFANASTGGTDTGANARGSFCGVNPVVSVAAGVTNIKGIKGIEVDISSGAGSSMGTRLGIDIVLTASNVAGASVDRGLQFSAANSGGTTVGFTEGIVFDKDIGGVAPISSTGTLFKTSGSYTIDTAIDCSSVTISSWFLKGPSSKFLVDGSGNTTIGANVTPDATLQVTKATGATVAPPADALLHLVGNDGAVSYLCFDTFAQQPIFLGRRSQGSRASKSALITDNTIFRVGGDGYDGTSYSTNAGFALFAAAENWSNTAHGTYLTFNTTPTGTTSFIEAFRADGKGVVLLNGTSIPAGGTAGAGYRMSSTSNFGIFFGSGAPTLSAAKGSLYLRSDGSATNDRAYINTNGTTTWTNLTTAA